MTETEKLIAELQRTIDRLTLFRDAARRECELPVLHRRSSMYEHATARRASLDATRALSEWRRNA